MSKSLNVVHLIGYTGSEPEIRTSKTGTLIAKVSLATNSQRKGRNGVTQEKAEWHRLTAFGDLADVFQKYVGKGERIYVEGRIEYDQTEGEDGHTRYWTDIIVNELIMLGSLDAERGAVAAADASEGDMPF